MDTKIKEEQLPICFPLLKIVYNKIQIGNLWIKKEKEKFGKNEYIKFSQEFSDSDPFIMYDPDENKVVKGNNFDSSWEEAKKIITPSEVDQIIEFELFVISNINEYVYQLFTISTTLNKSLNNKCNEKTTRYRVAMNILKYIDNIDSFEKMSKSIGKAVIYKNITSENFQLNEGNKVTQVSGLSKESSKLVKQLRLEKLLPDFQELSNFDKNYVSTLLNYAKDMKDIYKKMKFPVNEFSKNISWLLKYINRLLGFKKIGVEIENISVLLNYLIRENFEYAPKFCIPASEASELCDYLNIRQTLGGDLDVLPKNLNRAIKVLHKNEIIIERPRPVEFKVAVDKYADIVNWVPKNESKKYIFKAPESEADLLNEGNVLHHCVASYRDKIINGCIVVFMRLRDNPNMPFVTIEYENGVVVQAKQKYNDDIDDAEIGDAIEEWLATVKRREKNE
jgi:hypothetical protein